MPKIKVRGYVEAEAPAPYRLKVRLDGRSFDLGLTDEYGDFEALLDAPIVIDGPTDEAVVEFRATLDPVLAFSDDPSELLDDLGSSVPLRAATTRTFLLHLASQVADGAVDEPISREARQLTNARVDVFTESDADPIVSRSIHVSDELDGHTLGVVFEQPVLAVDDVAPFKAPASDDWKEKLAALLEPCQRPYEKLRHRRDRLIVRALTDGRVKQLKHGLRNGDWEFHRRKFPHRYGAVAQCRLDITDKLRFTGLLSSGATGLIRLSSGLNNPKFNIPGFALKFPITGGHRSVNLFALYRAEGTGRDDEFFRYTMGTSVPFPEAPKNTHPVSGLLLRWAQRQLLKKSVRAIAELGREGDPRVLIVDHAASIHQDGTTVDGSSVRRPDKLYFRPTPEVVEAFAAADPGEERGPVWLPTLLRRFSMLPPEIPVYTVHADDPEAKEFARLTLETGPTASPASDHRLHFEHWYPPRK